MPPLRVLPRWVKGGLPRWVKAHACPRDDQVGLVLERVAEYQVYVVVEHRVPQLGGDRNGDQHDHLPVLFAAEMLEVCALAAHSTPLTTSAA